jgi:hypothetical protein
MNKKRLKMIESYNQTDLFVFEKDLLKQILRQPNIPKITKVYLSDDILRRYKYQHSFYKDLFFLLKFFNTFLATI